jgi:hypothetical protein
LKHLYKIDGSKELENMWYDYLTKEGRTLNRRLKFDISGGQSYDNWFYGNTGNIKMNHQENKVNSGNYYEQLQQSLGLN